MLTENTTSEKNIIVCIPAYNEENSIAKVIVGLKKYVNKIIVVDDGSLDLTAEIAQNMGAEVIKHEKNSGKGAALRTAFNQAFRHHPDIVITIDGDGQHDPVFIPKLIVPIINGDSDVVIGSRYKQKVDMPGYRKIGLDMINYMCKKASKTTINDTQSGYRAYSVKALNSIAQLASDDYSVEFEQLGELIRNGYKIAEVPIEIKYKGLHKTSKKNFLSHGGELILSSLFTILQRRPVIYLTLPGFFLVSLALFYGVYTLYLFNETRYFSVPMSIASGVLILIGSLLVFSSMLIYIISKMKLNVK